MTCELSIVSPVYRASAIVPELVKQISHYASQITKDFEIILVDDRSPDDSWTAIQEASSINSHVRGIRLSRNFGQHRSISAGLDAAQGNFVIVMDCDLQDDPRYIPELYRKAQEGFDVVYAKKRVRQHSQYKNWSAIFYTRVFNFFAKEVQNDPLLGSYTILSRIAVDNFCRFTEYHRHYILLLQWLGFRVAHIEVDHNERHSGQSSYSFFKLVRHAIEGITSHSTTLLHISMLLGALFCVGSIGFTLYVIYEYFTNGLLAGWASLSVMISLSSGLILLCLGVIGLYIGKLFEQVKGRPLYIVAETVGESASMH